MGLNIPPVGTTPGPQYASNIDASMLTIDQHDHSLGNGVQITPSGLNINSALSIQGNNLTLIGNLEFQALVSSAALSSLYSIGVDLYYNDGSGNVIRITQSGSVAGAAGTITGLPSGTASASYTGGTFTFQSATSTAATIDAGSYIFRNLTPSSFGVTLQPPNALGGNYALTLPSIPSQTNVMTLDTAGNMGSITYDAVGQGMTSVGSNAISDVRTRTVGASVAAGGVAISSSSGSFSTSSASLVLVTNQSVSLGTTGRPVQVMLQPDANGTLNGGYIGAPPSGSGVVALVNNTTGHKIVFTIPYGAQNFPGSLSGVDTSVSGISGVQNYQIQAASPFGGGAVSVINCVLVAYEL